MAVLAAVAVAVVAGAVAGAAVAVAAVVVAADHLAQAWPSVGGLPSCRTLFVPSVCFAVFSGRAVCPPWRFLGSIYCIKKKKKKEHR